MPTHKKILDMLLIALALAVPFILILGRGAADTAMGLVSIAFLVNAAIKKDWQWAKEKWFLLALVLYAYMLVCGAFAEFDKEAALFSALAWIRFPLFAMAFSVWILPQEKAQKYFVPVLAAILVAVAMDALSQFVFGTSLSGHPKPDYEGRLTGPFNKMVVGIFLSRLCWPVIGHFFAWALRNPADKKKLIYPILFAALMGITILITGERMAFLLFGLGSVIFLFSARGLRPIIGAISAVGGTIAIIVLLFVPSLHERFVSYPLYTLNNLSKSAYTAVWTNGFVAWKYAPVMGIGLSNYVPMCEQLGRASGFLNEQRDNPEMKCTRHPHNIYLEWMAGTGLIGLGLFLGLVFLWMQKAWRNLKASRATLPEYYIALGYFITLSLLFWPIVASMSFFSNWSAITFWWVLAVALQPKKL